MSARRIDKKIADSEGISYPPKAELVNKDTGFQGYEPAVTRTCQAKKKPPRGELTAAEKRTNRKLARIRVNVEHTLAGVNITLSRIVKDVYTEHQRRSLDSDQWAAYHVDRTANNSYSCSEPQRGPLETVAKSSHILIKSSGGTSTTSGMTRARSSIGTRSACRPR